MAAAAVADNPLDPLTYELKEIRVHRDNDTDPFGVFVKSLASGRDPFICRVVDGSVADAAGLKAGDYVMAVNGRRVESKIELAEEMKRSVGEVTMIISRHRATPIDPCTLGPPANDQNRKGHMYFLCRLDPLRRRSLGITIAQSAGHVTVCGVTKDGAGFWGGIQNGDRVLTIADKEVHDLKNCRDLLIANEGKLFDVLVERLAENATHVGLPFEDPSLTLEHLTFARGVVAAGVPETPPEVKNIMRARAEAILKNIQKGCKVKPKPKVKKGSK